MKTMFLEGIEVSFNDFTEETQIKFYEAKKDEFREDASRSQFELIRELVAKDETTSNKVLNEMLKEEVTNINKQNLDVFAAIFKRKDFAITKENQELCAKSSDEEIHLWIVKNKNTSNEFLNEILKEEVTNEDKQDEDVLAAIFAREDFAITEENRKLCAKSSAWNIRLWIVKDENTSSELLDEILKEEVRDEYKQALDVLKAIFARENFTITEEKQRLCATNGYWKIRIWIVKDKNTSNDFLNEILKEEVTDKDKQNPDVLANILKRADFAITEENKRICKRRKEEWIRDLVK